MPWIVYHKPGKGITCPISTRRGFTPAKGSGNRGGRCGRSFPIITSKGLSHKPKSQHPSKISKKAAYKIKCFFDQSGRNGWSSIDVWAKVSSCGFDVSYSTVLRYIKRLDGYKPYETNPKRHGKKYHTPPFPGDKWQMDVKFVPSECKSPSLPGDKSYYQYTVLDEASRAQDG